MIRIWLGADDLARTRLVPEPLSEVGTPSEAVRSDLRAKSRQMAVAGVEGLFAVIHPDVRWRNPVLIVDAARDLDIRPNGAGLTFVPSVGTARPSVVRTDPADVFIAYPVAEAEAPRAPDQGEDPLAALLGRSRAGVLRAAAGMPGTTTDLARRAGISIPSASQHLTVLRAAGLLVTTRRGNAAHHVTTSLAHALLANAGV